MVNEGGLCIQINPLVIVAGAAVAAVSGYFSVKIMMKVLTSGNMRMFAIYLWVLGGLIVVDQFFTHFYF